MTKSITTYEELLLEKQRLTLLLQAQKELVRHDINDIREELKPLQSAVSVVTKLATKDRRNLLLTTATDSLIDLVLKKIVLSKAGWITKLAVPFMAKNFSSHFIADNKEAIMAQIRSLFAGKKQANGVLQETEEE
jgi:hypothetical protein